MKEDLIISIDDNRTIICKLNGVLHREDGPAVEYVNGEKQWYINGLLHRINGPAIIFKDGSMQYWIDGNRQHWLERPLLWDDGTTEN